MKNKIFQSKALVLFEKIKDEFGANKFTLNDVIESFNSLIDKDEEAVNFNVRHLRYLSVSGLIDYNKTRKEYKINQDFIIYDNSIIIEKKLFENDRDKETPYEEFISWQ